jgi:hypothetical protein
LVSGAMNAPIRKTSEIAPGKTASTFGRLSVVGGRGRDEGRHDPTDGEVDAPGQAGAGGARSEKSAVARSCW